MDEIYLPYKDQHSEEHVEFEINKFIDHELDPADEKKLFAHLAGCTSCRSSFSNYLKLKTEVSNFYTEAGKDFDEPMQISVLPSISKNYYKYPFYIAAAASVILALLFLFQFNNNSLDKMKLSELQTRYVSLEKKIDSLTRSINEKSAVDINRSFTVPADKPDNEDKIKIKTSGRETAKVRLSNNKNYSAFIPDKEKNNSYIQFINSLPMENITEDDFLTPQILGN